MRPEEALRRCDVSALRRAIRHHRRAIEALGGGSFAQLSRETVEKLLRQFADDLRLFERELARRLSPEVC